MDHSKDAAHRESSLRETVSKMGPILLAFMKRHFNSLLTSLKKSSVPPDHLIVHFILLHMDQVDEPLYREMLKHLQSAPFPGHVVPEAASAGVVLTTKFSRNQFTDPHHSDHHAVTYGMPGLLTVESRSTTRGPIMLAGLCGPPVSYKHLTAEAVQKRAAQGQPITSCPGGLGCCIVGLQAHVAGFEDLPVVKIIGDRMRKSTVASVSPDSTGPLLSAFFTPDGLVFCRTRQQEDSSYHVPTAPLDVNHAGLLAAIKASKSSEEDQADGTTIYQSRLGGQTVICHTSVKNHQPHVTCLWAETPVATPFGWLIPPCFGVTIGSTHSVLDMSVGPLVRRRGFHGGPACLLARCSTSAGSAQEISARSDEPDTSAE